MQISRKISGKEVNVSLSGKFTFSDHQNFRAIIEAIKKKEGNVIILDFTNVDFVDSAALGMLLVAREEASKNNVDLILENPVGHVQKMFELSDFNSMFNIR